MTDTQRAAFEAWASSEDMSTATGNCGWYIADGTAKAWRAWVAAQAADAGMEDQPSITNPLTPYGMLVRALRIVADVGHDEHNCWDEFLIARYK